MTDIHSPHEQQEISHEDQKNALRRKLENLNHEKRNLEEEFRQLAKREETNFVKEISQKIIEFAQDGIDIDVGRLLEKISSRVSRQEGKPLNKRAKNGTKKGPVNPPKYQNPDDANQTWTGKGRQPGWVVALLTKGEWKLDDLLIDVSEKSGSQDHMGEN